MTRKEATEELKEMKTDAWTDHRQMEAIDVAVEGLELLDVLIDRPCSACKYHKENGCCKWTCVFTDRLFGDMR